MSFDPHDRKGKAQLPALPDRSRALTLARHSMPSRHALTLDIPQPVLTHNWLGRPEIDRYTNAIREAQQVAEAVTDFNKKQVALEESCQELEKAQLERPYAIAMHEMRLDAALASLDRGLRQKADKTPSSMSIAVGC